MVGDITVEINFFSHTVDGSPAWAEATPKLGWIASNYAQTPARTAIHDLRGKESDFDLDKNGFEILKYDGHVRDAFNNDSEMQLCYFDDIVQTLKKRLGASRIIIFDHVTHFRGPTLDVDQCNANHKNPIFYPHVDNDPPAVRFKAKEVLGEEEAENVMQNRFQIMNVWRPLGPKAITNTPLTICDYRTTDPVNDIHISEVRGTKATNSLYMISRNTKDAQQWYYLSEMRSDEMFLIKIVDSNPDVAQFGAHTAFTDECAPPTDAEQVSIELRCLIVYDQ